MSSVQVLPPFEVFTDVDGNPLEDGFIYIGAPSVDPEANPVSTFWDAALTIPAVQPIRTKGGYPNNAGAQGRIYVGATTYSVRVRNKNSFTIVTDLLRSNAFIGGTLQDALNEAAPVTLPSAASVPIGSAASNTVIISGTATITSFDSIPAGAKRQLQFLASLTLTNNASIILPNGVNFVTQANDYIEFISRGAGVWECESVHRQISNSISLDVLGSSGIVVRTGSGAVTSRTITGTAAKITVANGSGVGGDPTLTIPDAVTLVTPTVTGQIILQSGQIVFPGVQAASANPNTLDDYEEGLWIPVLTCAVPGNLAITYSAQVGNYTKVGDLTYVSASIITTSFTHTTASGAVFISGLPFTPVALVNHTGSLSVAFSDGFIFGAPFGWMGSYVLTSSALMRFATVNYTTGASTTVNMTTLATGTNKSVFVSGTYKAA